MQILIAEYVTKCSNVLAGRWHVFWDRFVLFILSLKCDDTTICAALSNILIWRETYKTVHEIARL